MLFEVTDLFLQVALPCLLAVISILLFIIEHFAKKKLIFSVLSGVYCGAAALILLLKNSGLCGFLIFVLVSLAARLFLEINSKRKENEK